MTARAVPPEPQLTTESERSVWERLVTGLDDDEVVVSNLRLHADRDRELDLVVISPGRGVAVLEVKGGSVWVDGDGRWQQRTSYGTRRIDPVEQALGGNPHGGADQGPAHVVEPEGADHEGTDVV